MRKQDRDGRVRRGVVRNTSRQRRDCALVVMARVPRAGEVKTRLCPPLTQRESARFYACFLDDLLRGLGSNHRWDAWIAYTPGSYAYFRPREKAGYSLLRQRGRLLGTRMHAVFVDLFSARYQCVVVLGSDIPGVTPSRVQQAFELLKKGDREVVVGPSADGGYYLIGLRKPMRRLFQSVAWGSSRVFAQTLERAGEMEVRMATVQGSYDVDVGQDLERLWADLRKSGVLRRRLPATYRWFCEHYPAHRHSPGRTAHR